MCGSDGSTYDSECHMKAISCREGRDVSVQQQGKCGESFCHEIAQDVMRHNVFDN